MIKALGRKIEEAQKTRLKDFSFLTGKKQKHTKLLCLLIGQVKEAKLINS
ncbi:hypothetical protein X474_08490 [Dethiosulfatarculus sandiegensis]|uniref:Uncharacterized protein n=1 Tax=Dethiosulfatarculus sandiegensis TaxID=1429043 RepID=A0A0D2JYP0_9BACT|nr:hypothetical protein X474_08490 [Dethiosulfatarculus sandiegensis]